MNLKKIIAYLCQATINLHVDKYNLANSCNVLIQMNFDNVWFEQRLGTYGEWFG